MSGPDLTEATLLIERLQMTREAAEALRLLRAFAKLDSRRRSEILQMLEREAARVPGRDR